MQRSEEDEIQRSKEDKNQLSEKDESRQRWTITIISIVVVISQLSIAGSGIAFTWKLYEAHGGCSDQQKHCLTLFSTVWASVCYLLFFSSGCSFALARYKKKPNYTGGHYVLVGLSVCFCLVWFMSAIFYIEEVNLEEKNHARTFASVLLGLFCFELLLLVVIAIYEKRLLTQDSAEEISRALAGDHTKVYDLLEDGS